MAFPYDDNDSPQILGRYVIELTDAIDEFDHTVYVGKLLDDEDEVVDQFLGCVSSN